MSPENSENTENYEQMSFLDGANKVLIPVESIVPDNKTETSIDKETVTQISPLIEDSKQLPNFESKESAPSLRSKSSEKEKVEWYKDPKILTVYWILKNQYTKTSELWPLFKNAERENPGIIYNDIKKIVSKYCEVIEKRHGKNRYKWNEKFVLPDSQDDTQQGDKKVYNPKTGMWEETSDTPHENLNRRPFSLADMDYLLEKRKEENEE